MTTVFRLDITLDEPAILTDGSSEFSGGHLTLAAIPGTTVLGAVAAAMGVSPDREPDLFRRLFLSAATRFLNAYPEAAGERSLPRPRTFRQGKLDRRRVIDTIGPAGDLLPQPRIADFFGQASPADRPKSGGTAFVLASSPGIDRSPDCREQVHVAIDRRRRAAEQGVLFNYSSLPAGTVFRSVVITDDAAAAQRLDDACRAPLRMLVGRSRRGGYGRATARLEQLPGGWQEFAARTGSAERVIVTLLSDYLPVFELDVVDAFTADLRSACGLEPTTRIEPVEVSVRSVTGFRGVWGLPRSPRTAIEKGAVFVIHGAVDQESLGRAAATGLGGRLNEGFGRIAFDWDIHGREATPAVDQPPTRLRPARARPHVADAKRVGSVVTALAARRHARQRRRFVELALSHGRTQAAVKKLVAVPPAQLGNLRAAMASSLSAGEIGRWFADLTQKTAGDRWRSARVPPLRGDDFRRNGVGFVWRSLLGGETDRENSSDDPSGAVNFEIAVKQALLPLCADDSLHGAALADPDRTLRLFVIGLCGDVVRARNTRNAGKEGRP